MRRSQQYASRLFAGLLLGASAIAAVPRGGEKPRQNSSPVASRQSAGDAPGTRVAVTPDRGRGGVMVAGWASPQTEPERAQTLLDEVGRLAHGVSEAQFSAWKATLKQSKLAHGERARLHVWVGEYELGRNEQPKRAIGQFLQAKRLTGPTHPLRGLAMYDTALAQFRAGVYDEAAASFRELLVSKSGLRGFDRRRCALGRRQAAACAGYHARLAAQGIPQSRKLDPECAAAALAVCLRSLSLPHDRAAVLAACRVTGEGSTAKDLLDACRKLGLVGRLLTADDEGLKALPKPAVAHVERDRFVAVLGTDAKGVSYACSCCGNWPGERVKVTWEQWRAIPAWLPASAVT